MSVDSTLVAWKTWLANQFAPLSNPVVYLHAPPWPYTGSYPYIIVLPRTQHRYRYSSEEVYLSGLFRLVYVDAIGANYTSIADLLEAATAWCELLADTLQDHAYPQNRSLNNEVDYVGEDGDGLGITIAFDEKQSFLTTDNIPAFSLPIDVWVRGLPESG